MRNESKILMKYYKKLLNHFGPLHWWPAETPFEVMVGAILTQNTNWTNVEKAIANLKVCGILLPHKLHKIDEGFLAQLIRPAGYFNIKARRLKNFIKWFVERYNGDVGSLAKKEIKELREELLSISGIGRETADSIILYALEKPTFVVDAYTYRIFHRHRLIPEETSYEEIKEFFETNLPADEKLYNEYHAQIVKTGKMFCRTKPLCDKCPLKPFLPEI